MILNVLKHTYYTGHRPLCLHTPPPEDDSSRLSGLQPHPQGVGAHSLSRGPQGVPPSRSVLTREPRRASSYLTQFHLVVQVSYSMCASALLKRTSSCWDTRKLNQVIMGNTRKLNQVKLKINHRRHLMHVATNPKLKTRFSAKLKNESQKVDSNGMAALTSFSTAGVKSHA